VLSDRRWRARIAPHGRSPFGRVQARYTSKNLKKLMYASIQRIFKCFLVQCTLKTAYTKISYIYNV